jgi:hypothetical protein
MSADSHQITTNVDPNDAIDGIDDTLIDTVWHELDKQLPRERVSHVVTEIGLAFRNTMVKTFVPIFVHRRALEQLRRELNGIVPADDRSLNEHG